MENAGLIVLLVLLAIVVIGCIIRSVKHHNMESKFDVPADDLVSTEIQGDHYVVYFDASRFPMRSDDASDSYYTYTLTAKMEKTGRVAKGVWIATVQVIKHSSTTTPSTGTFHHSNVFKEYRVHCPYEGVVSSKISGRITMSKFALCDLKPGTEEEEKDAENTAILNAYGISEKYFNDVDAASKALGNFKNSLCLNISVRDAVAAAFAWPDENVESHINYLISIDALGCFEGSGTSLALDSNEGFGLMALCWALISKEPFPEYKHIEAVFRTAPQTAGYIQTLKQFARDSFPNKKLVFTDILASCDAGLREKYLVLLSRWASIVANADGTITDKEKEWLDKLSNLKDEQPQVNSEPIVNEPEKAVKEPKPARKVASPKKGDPLKELEGMIGLTTVKEEIKTLYNFVKVQKMRQDSGMQTSSVSYHCVFTGNPGTGKTTVARIVAEIYRDLGILEKGHLVETDRSGLVAEYVGQTAVKTNKIIDSALDGVLFIDEAYSLAEGGQGDFGREAIATLLKRMEDDRDRIVVILAGYSSNMKGFIDSNPGLQSRFNRYIHFPDYTASELYDIFMLSVKKGEYTLTKEAESKLKAVLEKAITEKDVNFGNGRFVRNMFEKTIQRQANRISVENNVTNELLSQITDIDIPD